MTAPIASRDSDVTRVDGSPSLAKLKRYFTEARDLTQQARTNALQAIDYYDSDQFTGTELAKLVARGQPPVVINRIKPAINGILPVPGLRTVDQNGVPLAGALLQFYLTGTTTPTPVYTSSDLTTPLSNPVVADSTGLFPAIYYDPAITYRAQLYTAAGGLVDDTDPVAAPYINALASITASMLASGAAAGNLGYASLNKAGDTATNLLLASTAIASTSAGYLGAPVNEQDGGCTFALSDAGGMVRCNSAAAETYTIPLNSAVALPVGTVILIRNVGAGVLTVHVTSGVSLAKAGGTPQGSIALAQYALATMIQEAGNAWVMSGVGLT